MATVAVRTVLRNRACGHCPTTICPHPRLHPEVQAILFSPVPRGSDGEVVIIPDVRVSGTVAAREAAQAAQEMRKLAALARKAL